MQEEVCVKLLVELPAMCLLNSLARVTVECSDRGRWQLGRIAARSYCKQLTAGVWFCFTAAHVHSIQQGLTDMLSVLDMNCNFFDCHILLSV